VKHERLETVGCYLILSILVAGSPSAGADAQVQAGNIATVHSTTADTTLTSPTCTGLVPDLNLGLLSAPTSLSSSLGLGLFYLTVAAVLLHVCIAAMVFVIFSTFHTSRNLSNMPCKCNQNLLNGHRRSVLVCQPHFSAVAASCPRLSPTVTISCEMHHCPTLSGHPLRYCSHNQGTTHSMAMPLQN